jgi:hypothetical protein
MYAAPATGGEPDRAGEDLVRVPLQRPHEGLRALLRREFVYHRLCGPD